MSQQIITLYQEKATLKTNVVNVQDQSKVYEFDPKELEKNLRGNKKYENLLQEKRVCDAFVIGQTKSAIKSLTRITSALVEQH
jgi:uncharacterized protein (UPF0335 family)